MQNYVVTVHFSNGGECFRTTNMLSLEVIDLHIWEASLFFKGIASPTHVTVDVA